MKVRKKDPTFCAVFGKMYLTIVGEEEISSTPQDSSSCSKNQTDMRHINRRKNPKFNYVGVGKR